MAHINLALFASGNGTNAERIVYYFAHHPQIQISIIYSNRADARVHHRAKKLGVPSETFSKEEFLSPSFFNRVKCYDYLVLTGFLWLLPKYLIEAFPDKIINIHPALLPKFGGKGMYGRRVHEAVLASKETESGITIHLVNERYDEGRILFQAKCEVTDEDTSESLEAKIHQLEYKYFPRKIEEYVWK